MKRILYLLCIHACLFAKSQDWSEAPTLNWSGFVDVYYAYDFNKPSVSERQLFLYNHNRHNEFNLNLAVVKLNVDHSKYRANIAVQSGNYATDVYALEEAELRMIQEANAGIVLNSEGNLWLDAGIFGSHLGFESPWSIDNPTLTRSLVAESSPYYLAGAKVTWTLSDVVEVVGVVSNGWQRIRRVQGNSKLSYGTQLVIKPSENTTINWSTFVTTEDPDDSRRVMYFSNLYGMFQINDKLSAIAGLDYGQRQVAPESNTTEVWVAPVGIVKLQLSEKYATAFRAEYFKDPNGVVNGLEVLGLSANFDYTPVSNVAFRVEARWFDNQYPVFQSTSGQLTQTSNMTILGSLAIKFNGSKE